MKLLQQFQRFSLSLGLAIVLTIFTTFGFGFTSWAAPLSFSPMGAYQGQAIALFGWEKAKAKTNEIEGKAQEALGNFTDDPKDQMMGTAKQAAGQMHSATADLKDQIKLQERAKAVTKNIEGNAQEAMGKTTGNLKDQMTGSAKQLESQARNTVEDLKEMAQDMLK